MATDTLLSYQERQFELKRAERKVDELVAALTDAVNKLRNWDNVVISNVYVPFPAELSLFGAVIDGSNLPSAQELAQALSEYHRLRIAAQITYRKIPDDFRVAIGEL